MTETVAEDYRLDLQYHAIKLLLNEKLFLAPVKNPGRILDCGTGTGWHPVGNVETTVALMYCVSRLQEFG